jgi:TolB-like protein/Tfp pilus assembly protein PilF
MQIWFAEIKELESLYTSIKGRFPELEKDLEHLIKTDDENVALLYSRRCLEIIITDLCESELNRPRKTEPLKGIIDKLHREEKVPSHIITSMDHLNSLSTYGAHPKEFDPEQVKPVLFNLITIIKWYLKYKETQTIRKARPEEVKHESKELDDNSKDTPKPKKRWILLLSGLTLVIVIVVLALFIFHIIGGGKQTRELEKSIAVLPFIDDSQDKENTSFINGIMDEVLINLQTIKDLRVPGRTSVEQYRNNATKSIPEIARELGVNYIVEGSGQKYGNTFVLRIQLLEGKKDKHLWGESYEQRIEEVEDIINIQSQIAQAIATELKAIITPEEKQLIEKTPTFSLTAYDFYLRGKEELVNYWLNNDNKETLKEAEHFYNNALEYDSNFAPAYAGLALVYRNQHSLDVNSYFAENYLDSSMILANRALYYDEQLAEAYYVRGWYYLENGKPEQAVKEFDKALKYNPNYWEVYADKGRYVYLMDNNNMDFVKAIENLHKAVSLNHGRELPELMINLGIAYGYAGIVEVSNLRDEIFNLINDTSLILYYSASIEINLGNYAIATDLANKAFKLDSNNIDILQVLASGYMNLGQYKESLKYFKKYIERSKDLGHLRLNSTHRIAYVYWQNGYKKEAEYYFDEQKRNCEEAIKKSRRYSTELGAYYDLAGIYAFHGQKEKAYENLRTWATIPVPPLWWVVLIKNDPLFDSIRDEPEFQQIVRDVEAKYQAEHERVRKWLEEQGML